MALLTSQRAIDLRSVCFSEGDVFRRGEWWRLLANFFFMGDSVKSVFFWFQLHHFWECLKVRPGTQPPPACTQPHEPRGLKNHGWNGRNRDPPWASTSIPLQLLELVKYRWEPSDLIKMIVCNAAMLLVLKQFFPAMIFLGSPMVMVFIYMYSREYEVQVMNLLGFFQIRCGWLPFAQVRHHPRHAFTSCPRSLLTHPSSTPKPLGADAARRPTGG